MFDKATELCELRGLPEAIQKQFEEQQKKATGKDDEKDLEGPLTAMSQWKALLDSNKKASSLPPGPVKAGFFTAACEKVKATHLHLQPQAAHSCIDKHSPICVDDS